MPSEPLIIRLCWKLQCVIVCGDEGPRFLSLSASLQMQTPAYVHHYHCPPGQLDAGLWE